MHFHFYSMIFRFEFSVSHFGERGQALKMSKHWLISIEKEAGIWMSHLPVPNSNLCSLAEGVGFEPTCPKGQTVFKTASL